MRVALRPAEVETTAVMKHDHDRLKRSYNTYLCIPEGISSPRFVYEVDKLFSIEFGKTLRIKYKVVCETAVSQEIKRPVPEGAIVHFKLVCLIVVLNRYYILLKLVYTKY